MAETNSETGELEKEVVGGDFDELGEEKSEKKPAAKKKAPAKKKAAPKKAAAEKPTEAARTAQKESAEELLTNQ